MSADVIERSEPGKPKGGEGGEKNFFARSVTFVAEAQAEMKKVTWPTRDELVKATRMILIFSVVLGIMIGLLDLVLQKVLVDGVALLAR